ncbi:MAG: hypothetical protein ABIQ31_21645 [Ferruginibacter sp.]
MAREVVIITRYFLPNVNVDSDAVYKMVQGLKENNDGIKIHIVTTESKYKTDVNDDSKYSLELLKDVKIYKIKSVFSKPASAVTKLLSDLIEGYKLVVRARKLNLPNIVSLSNPPLIAMWHSLLLKKYNFFYWSFDIFPQAFVSDQIVKSGSAIYQVLKKNTYRNAPKSIIALGENQFDFLQETYNKPINKIILPCGIHNEQLNVNQPLPFWKDAGSIIIGYLGNLGRPHSITFLKNVITAVANRSNFKLILSVYGYHSEELHKHLDLTKSNNIFLVDFIDKSQLGLIDVHLVSLMESWANISVPSKAVSAVCSGGALWYCGPGAVDTWSMFKECSFKTSDQLAEVATCLDTINTEVLAVKKSSAAAIKEKLLQTEKSAYQSIYNSLQ